jgi:hypothetical protein
MVDLLDYARDVVAGDRQIPSVLFPFEFVADDSICVYADEEFAW